MNIEALNVLTETCTDSRTSGLWFGSKAMFANRTKYLYQSIETYFSEPLMFDKLLFRKMI